MYPVCYTKPEKENEIPPRPVSFCFTLQHPYRYRSKPTLEWSISTAEVFPAWRLAPCLTDLGQKFFRLADIV